MTLVSPVVRGNLSVWGTQTGLTMAEAALLLGASERHSFSLRLIRLAEPDQSQDEQTPDRNSFHL